MSYRLSGVTRVTLSAQFQLFLRSTHDFKDESLLMRANGHPETRSRSTTHPPAPFPSVFPSSLPPPLSPPPSRLQAALSSPTQWPAATPPSVADYSTCSAISNGDGTATMNITAPFCGLLGRHRLTLQRRLPQAHFIGGTPPTLAALTPMLAVAAGTTVN